MDILYRQHQSCLNDTVILVQLVWFSGHGILQQWIRSAVKNNSVTAYIQIPNDILMNGKGPYGNSWSKAYETFTVTQGTYT